MQHTKTLVGKVFLVSFLLVLLSVLVVTFLGKSDGGAASKDNSPVARFADINGQTEITRAQLDEHIMLLQTIHPQLAESMNTSPGARIGIEQQILSSMIDSLLHKKAVTALGLEPDPLVTESIYQNLRQQTQGNPAISEALLRAYATETNYGQKLFTYFQTQLTESRLYEFWEANPWIGNIPAMVSLSNIVVETEAEATDIRAQIIAGADFGDLAATRSIEPGANATRGSKVFPAEQIGDQTVADTVKQMAIGDISQPIKTNMGWQIIKLANRTEGKELTFDEARPQVLGQASHTELLAHLQKLRDAAGIEILLVVAQPEQPKPNQQ